MSEFWTGAAIHPLLSFHTLYSGFLDVQPNATQLGSLRTSLYLAILFLFLFLSLFLTPFSSSLSL